MPKSHLFLFIFGLGIVACSTPSSQNSTAAPKFQALDHTRGPAQAGSPAIAPGSDEDDEPQLPPPPLAQVKATWIFSWTNRDEALRDPSAFATQAFARAKTCVDRIHASPEKLIDGCEGNDFAAGPGLYTCDNPFTSHDYGTIAVALRTRPENKSTGLATGKYTPRPGDGGLDRTIFGNPSFDALVYDFRPNDFGGRALVVRGESVVDLGQTQSLSVRPEKFRRFKYHPAFTCSETSSLKNVLENWGDQMEFLAVVFNFYKDSANENYLKKGRLNLSGVMAAIASDAAALSEKDLLARIAELSQKYKEVKDTANAQTCSETTNSRRMCFSQLVLHSLQNNEGSPQEPNDVWKLPTLLKVLVDLKLMAIEQTKGIKSHDQLQALLVKDFYTSPERSMRALEAYNCMLSVKKQLEPGSLKNWGDDPN